MAATANITPNDGPPRDDDVRRWVKAEQARRQTRKAAIPAALAGLLLLGLALPRFVGEVALWPARGRILDIQTGLPPAENSALAAAAASIETFGSLTSDGRLVADGGLLLMHQAAATSDPAERTRLLHRAVVLTERGLQSTPAHPVGWSRLAALHVALGDPAAAARALRLSLLSGPIVPQIMASRLQQGLGLLPHLDEDGQRLLARQVRLLHTIQPERLAALRSGPEGEGEAFIHRSLADADQESRSPLGKD